MMAESMPGDHYTLVRNPRYYRASEGLALPGQGRLPHRADQNAILKDLQAGPSLRAILSAGCEQGAGVPAPQQLYTRHSSHECQL